MHRLTYALALSLVCSFAVSAVYRITHKATSYSQNYVHTLVLMALVTTFSTTPMLHLIMGRRGLADAPATVMAAPETGRGV